MISTGPMLMRSRSTSTSVALCASAGAQTAAALFHSRDLEGRGVGNCLNVLEGEQVGICPRNGRELSVVQIRNRLLESGWIDVGIIRAAAIARPPTGVHRELHQVGQPQLSAGSRRGAAWQCAERFQVYG